MARLYKILKGGKIIESPIPGKYAGCKTTGIFGKVHDACNRAYEMNPGNRVFFHSLEEAVRQGYRPCKGCRPIVKAEFELIKHLVPFATLDEFYDTKPARKTEFTYSYF